MMSTGDLDLWNVNKFNSIQFNSTDLKGHSMHSSRPIFFFWRINSFCFLFCYQVLFVPQVHLLHCISYKSVVQDIVFPCTKVVAAWILSGNFSNCEYYSSHTVKGWKTVLYVIWWTRLMRLDTNICDSDLFDYWGFFGHIQEEQNLVLISAIQHTLEYHLVSVK
jgi:hypothetical protein